MDKIRIQVQLINTINFSTSGLNKELTEDLNKNGISAAALSKVPHPPPDLRGGIHPPSSQHMGGDLTTSHLHNNHTGVHVTTLANLDSNSTTIHRSDVRPSLIMNVI